MPEWLQDTFPSDVEASVSLLAGRLAAALVLGCVVAGVYRVTRRSPSPPGTDAASLVPTLVLLTVIIAMVTLAIGNSVARAFSLVGALAIVRFRTVVEDTRDTAFVIFAVAVGLAVGAGFLAVPVVGIPFAAVAAFLFRSRAVAPPAEAPGFTLKVRVGAAHAPDALLTAAFGKYVAWSRLTGTATARQGACLDLAYSVRLHGEDAAVALVSELNRLEGVQEVELRQT